MEFPVRSQLFITFRFALERLADLLRDDFMHDDGVLLSLLAWHYPLQSATHGVQRRLYFSFR